MKKVLVVDKITHEERRLNNKETKDFLELFDGLVKGGQFDTEHIIVGTPDGKSDVFDDVLIGQFIVESFEVQGEDDEYISVGSGNIERIDKNAACGIKK